MGHAGSERDAAEVPQHAGETRAEGAVDARRVRLEVNEVIDAGDGRGALRIGREVVVIGTPRTRRPDAAAGSPRADRDTATGATPLAGLDGTPVLSALHVISTSDARPLIAALGVRLGRAPAP